MKFLLVVLVVLVGFFVWRSNRRESLSRPPVRSTPPSRPLQDMVACAQCGLHLPRAEAVPGRRALYCSAEHLGLSGDERA
jgi:uncharacterized protein